MLSRISSSALRARSEGIDRVALHHGPDVCAHAVEVDHVDLSLWRPKQSRDFPLHARIVPERDGNVGREADQHVEVAIRTSLAARDRAEDAGAGDAAATERGLACLQSG